MNKQSSTSLTEVSDALDEVNIRPLNQDSLARESYVRLRSESNTDICEQLEELVSDHPASQHALFSSLKWLVASGRLSAKQFDVFRRGFFGRIFPTMLNITRLAAHALENANYHVFHTALHNLNDEGGTQIENNDLSFHLPHPALAERAFNAVATHAYHLDNLTLKEAFNSPRLPEEITQRAVFDYAYNNQPVIASWVQERASGGNGKSQKGMLGDLFEVFAPFQTQIDKDIFQSDVIPYFSAHVHLTKTPSEKYSFEYSPHAVEHLHSERALVDLRNHLSQQETGLHTILALSRSILDAQAKLFDAILQEIELIDSTK